MKKLDVLRNIIWLIFVIEMITISILTTNKLIELKDRVIKLETQIIDLQEGK